MHKNILLFSVFPFCSVYIVCTLLPLSHIQITLPNTRLCTKKQQDLITHCRLSRVQLRFVSSSNRTYFAAFVGTLWPTFRRSRPTPKWDIEGLKTNIPRTRKTKNTVRLLGALFQSFRQQLQIVNTMIIIFLNVKQNMMVGRTQIGLICEIFKCTVLIMFAASVTCVYLYVICFLFCDGLNRYYIYFYSDSHARVKAKKYQKR